jgi:plasmid stabilization system protein ParE
MSWQIIVRSPAEQDIVAACQWYAAQGEGLDVRFLEALDDTLRRVTTFPESSPIVDTIHRRVLLRTFPYGVYYQLDQERIVVKAVLHLVMDPGAVQERLDR